MYVCICNAIRESDLRAVAPVSTGCPERAYAALGKTPCCGGCLCHAEAVLADELARCECPAIAA